MRDRGPYQVVKSRYMTEKARMLQELATSESNKCTKACQETKYVFLVDKLANKREIARAVEEIYAERKVRVTAVNTINMKAKKRRVRGKLGKKPAFKKAVVTLAAGGTLDEAV